jgi:uncharacterized protein
VSGPATPSPSIRPPARVSDDIAYVLPMGAFLAFTWVAGQWPGAFAWTYVAKTIAAAALLWLFWRQYTAISWRFAGLGVLVGVVGVVQWVGMERLILHYWPNYPRMSHEAFDPWEHFAGPGRAMMFIAVRWAGASLVVPVMEELFWRDFLWRSVLAPSDFKLAGVGEWDLKTFIIVAVAFGAGVHIEWMTAIVWGLLIGALLVKTKSLGACIIAHGVTNFLLGAYVLYTGQWSFW